MNERRKHKRLPAIKDLAEPIQLTIVDNHSTKLLPGVLTNLSAGGMDLVLMGTIEGNPTFRMSIHLPGFTHFVVEGKMVWSRPKGSTTVLGIQFSKIDKDNASKLNHMAEAYWECEDRVRTRAPIVCFHGCTYWDMCEKPVKLRSVPKPSILARLEKTG